jgi:hypothetical protein
MHYCGIVDIRDVDWYDTVLKECSSLDVNDFLHDVSPYMTNRSLPPYRAAATAGGQGAPSTSAPPVRLVETEIFHDSHKRRLSQYPNISGEAIHGHLFWARQWGIQPIRVYGESHIWIRLP